MFLKSLVKIQSLSLISASLLISLTAPAYARSGGFNGGGGYALKCSEQGADVFYSYDYKMTENLSVAIDPELNSAPDAIAVLNSISTQLMSKLPTMAASLKDFARLNTNEFETTEHRLWTYGTKEHPLINIHNEARLREITECDSNAVQAVVWSKPSKQIQYDADAEVLKLLSQASSNANRNPVIQLSFLYVHEWLRDYTDDPVVIAKVDRLFHSSGWKAASGEQLRTALINRGLPVKSLPTAKEVAAAKRLREAVERDRQGLRSKIKSIQESCDPKLGFLGATQKYSNAYNSAEYKEARKCAKRQLTKLQSIQDDLDDTMKSFEGLSSLISNLKAALGFYY